MIQSKKLIPIILAMMILSLPTVASAQVLGIHVYESRTSLGMLVMDESFNATTEVYHLVFGQAQPDSPSYRPWNIGLGLVEVVFSLGKYPKNLYAYIEVGGEPLIDMLINFTISDKTHEFPNGTQVDAKYVSAFIYLFANHSIINETTVLPWLAPASYTNHDSSVLAEGPVLASEIEQVTVSYDMKQTDDLTIPIVVVSIGAGIILLVVLVLLKRTGRV